MTLRVLNPVAPINPYWCEESLLSAIQRLMEALNSVELTRLDQPYMVDMQFSCYLPLIKIQLFNGARTIGNMDKLIDAIIRICDLHVSDDQVKNTR